MISHKHKVIFIHIPKCAGSSFGWDNKNKLYLQHATPQELLDFNLITQEQWNSYYKFIIVRNTWDKVMSDFFWFKATKKFKGSLYDYLNAKNDFSRFMRKGEISYRGDHLTPQINYMFLNSELINYDRIIYFDKKSLNEELAELAEDIGLSKNLFQKKVQVNKKFIKHYSKFYTDKMKNQVYLRYKKDINFFDFKFKDEKSRYEKIKLKFFNE